MTLEDCAVIGNTCFGDYTASRDRGTYGGGIYANGLDLRDSVISGNAAIGYGAAGGGIYSVGGAERTSGHGADASIPPASRPDIFMDIGDNDPELTMAREVETIFNDAGLTHQWHLYSGAHTETYWSAHVEEYIRWYAKQWNEQAQ